MFLFLTRVVKGKEIKSQLLGYKWIYVGRLFQCFIFYCCYAEAVAWKYDPIHRTWKGKTTLAFVGSPLALEKGKKGSQRDAFNVEYMDQDEPMGRYKYVLSGQFLVTRTANILPRCCVTKEVGCCNILNSGVQL